MRCKVLNLPHTQVLPCSTCAGMAAVVHSNLGVLPLPQSLSSATRMSVFHMYVSSHHSATQGRGAAHTPFLCSSLSKD